MGFLQLRRQYQISHEVQQGAQRASHVVLGTSGLRACGAGECVIAVKVGARSRYPKDPFEFKNTAHNSQLVTEPGEGALESIPIFNNCTP